MLKTWTIYRTLIPNLEDKVLRIKIKLQDQGSKSKSCRINLSARGLEDLGAILADLRGQSRPKLLPISLWIHYVIQPEFNITLDISWNTNQNVHQHYFEYVI